MEKGREREEKGEIEGGVSVCEGVEEERERGRRREEGRGRGREGEMNWLNNQL